MGKLRSLKAASSHSLQLRHYCLTHRSDMVLTHNVPVTGDTVVVYVCDEPLRILMVTHASTLSVWQASEDAIAVAERGLRLIHQPSNYFYLARSPLKPSVQLSCDLCS